MEGSARSVCRELDSRPFRRAGAGGRHAAAALSCCSYAFHNGAGRLAAGHRSGRGKAISAARSCSIPEFGSP